ncbi:hypothetical protein Barba15S_gp081 [Rheinheimera phage vB_RspM_Barba15S]|jgi:hypothetical protein|uniref:Uncharacterized protein n=83 Tax=Barbavirus TaxID=2733095 RepID=A0A4P8NGZ9_9CAUD|nr:hypothetical protein Barba11S_gp080 [Rheinheimera phage vB_RspM_Barba11S]QCQ60539.1 hypothetical protein Barba12S_gp081 [Rheinheimera phage vB_RspM_Barba12S]QCQ60951.1 hypothetical protein Barba14S_gp081 [Rheinheimera phage vB_RspM_Barba14S]QCQ61233.1 hypothetical protein Barba15S_gp081 [Rheinheimera phage vB_RspM_Barba15S]QCQ61646.1 hypothetical protein Barba17S_gp083 [Rheinheimera phage vB_RspM_Barba17S]QCQ62754.1 hypothetical protein Barba22S_gp081 [Rheinheimera phage vB_RspM_Barba22S]Q
MMTTKAIKQLEEFFDLSSKPVLNQLNEIKTFINTNSDNMDEDELAFYTANQRGLELQYELEKNNPLAQRVYDNLLTVMTDKEVAKILNVLTSDNYQVFYGAIDDVLQKHAENILKLIDSGIEQEKAQKNKVVH